MAEIKIEKKKPVWPWILIGLIILAVVFFLVFANEDDDEFNEDTDELRELDSEDTLGVKFSDETTYYV
ncbi:MAG: hypothetical protein ABJ092_02520 [Gillisia sp.]